MPRSQHALSPHGPSFMAFSWEQRRQVAGSGPCRVDVWCREGLLQVTHPPPCPGRLSLGLAWCSVSGPDSWAGVRAVLRWRSPASQMRWSEPAVKKLPLKNLFRGDRSVFHALCPENWNSHMTLHFPCVFPRVYYINSNRQNLTCCFANPRY